MASLCTGECLRQLDNGDYTEVGENCPNPIPCTPQKCVNFPMCGSTGPLWLLQCKEGRCVQPCDMMYGRSFEFFMAEDLERETCPVCLEHAETYMKYPCGHLICPACFCPLSLIYPKQEPDEQEFGYQYPDDDDHHEKCLQEWKVLHPDQYEAWMAAQVLWQDNQSANEDDCRKLMQLMKKCPLCRGEGAPLGTDAHWVKRK